jgi:two-component system sensor histidine kinase YesM
MKVKSRESLTNTVQQSSELINNKLDEIVKISNLIFDDSNIHKLCKGETPQTEKYMPSVLASEADPTLSSYVMSHPSIASIALITEKKNLLFSIDVTPYTVNFPQIRERYLTFANFDGFTRGIVWYPTHEVDYISMHNNSMKIVKLVRDIYNQRFDYLGTAIINIRESTLSTVFPSVNNMKGTKLVVLNEDGDVITSTEEQLIGKNQNSYPINKILDNVRKHDRYQGDFIEKYNNKSYMFVYKKLKNQPWVTIAMISVREMQHETNRVVSIILIVFLVFLIISVVGSLSIAYSISKPIKQLSAAMRDVQGGNFDTVINIKSRDEIGILAQCYNTMIYKIKQLVDEVQESHVKEKKSEIKALQAQINPHFLYNTLESVMWLAEGGENDKIIEMVSRLGKYYRLSLSKGMDIVTIRSELEHVKNYLEIEKCRFGDKFNYEIKCDERIEQHECLKLILQPLVENSLLHGIMNKEIEGIIHIEVEKEEKNIFITISDNGSGITAERLKEINECFSSGNSKVLRSSYGIKNVNERIQLRYGKEYGLSYSSIYGEWTTVKIRLPFLFENQDGGV